MSLVVLCTDFGSTDEFVGVMKGVVLSLCPRATLVDLCHELPPGDVAAAARMLRASWRFFPSGAVFLCVVDPGVGTDRRVLACEGDGRLFVAPDNGLLGPLAEDGVLSAAFSVSDPRLFLSPVSPTFHGRDVFAPVAARLAAGAAPGDLGRPVPVEDLVRPDPPAPRLLSLGVLEGRITGADRFGNLVTDLPGQALSALAGARGLGVLRVEVAGRALSGVRNTYADAPPGEPVALVGSRGFLEIAVNRGNAAQTLPAAPGDPVLVTSVGA